MKHRIFFAVAATAFLLSSCGEEWLDVPSKTQILESNYYSTQERLFTGLVAAYDPLEWFDYFYQYNALNMVSDIMADDVYCGGSNEGDQPILVKTHYYTCSSTDVPNQIWTVAYSGINRANIVIAKAPEIEMDDATRNLYIAEATVLKAFYWNILWKFWGNIPYYEENLSADASYSAEQLQADEVYAKVIALLESAIDMKVLPMKAAAGDEGRVTQAMAYMLHAEMVMYQNDESRYAKSLDYMKEIISSGKYSLVADYEGIFREAGEWCDESIFEINYESVGGGRDWGWPNGTGGTVYPVLIGIPGAKTGSGFRDGWGFEPVRAQAYAMFDPADIRRDGSILDWTSKDANGGDYQARWQNTGYFLNKYIAREGDNHDYAADANLNNGNNQRIYRYAETLLNAAELSVRTSADGSSYLNLVRSRAGLGAVACNLDNIIEERHLEFVGEGKRYWDLVRTGKAATVLTKANHEYRPNDWSANKKYWPLPQSEIDRSVTPLTQNPY